MASSSSAPGKALTKLTLYRGFDWPGRYTWSPFVCKLETRLRLAGVPYVAAPGHIRQSPRGKIPYVQLANGEQMSDSTLITQRLINDGAIPDLNAGLLPLQRAQDLAWRALMEDKLYFYGVRERWQENYTTMRSSVMASIPYPIQLLVGLLAYNKITATLNGQGTGLLTSEEVDNFQREAWETINTQLSEVRLRAAERNGNAPFWILGGDQPTEADATLMGFIVSTLVCDAAPESGKLVRTFPVVIDYCQRVHDRYFSDYEKWSD